jgi:hypothetical protein
MNIFRIFIFLLFSNIFTNVIGQNVKIYGYVFDKTENPIGLVSIKIENSNLGTSSDENGYFELEIKSNHTINLVFSHIGYETFKRTINPFSGNNIELKINLVRLQTSLKEVEITAEKNRGSSLTKIDIESTKRIPTISGGIEDVIKTLEGVSSNNELSSQYSVRGGNYDENLIYVNGIEIYRPFLIRSGQQEGLSFLNSDLVSSIAFSAGGFDAKYGDKMSSVLDITYKKPTTFRGSISLGLIGNQVHIEGISRNNKLSCLIGFRHKTNHSLLSSLDTKGDYQPTFYDFQASISYQINKIWELFFLGNYTNNTYKLVPSNRETSFGTLNEAYQFKIYFNGQEIDKFETIFGAVSLNYKPNNTNKLQFIASAFQTNESETFDIQGQYWIGRLEPTINSDELKTPIESKGIGTHLNHARNYLDATVINFEIKGNHISDSQILDWGMKFQHENITDKINEWEMLDSASYSLPNSISIPGNPNPAQGKLILFNSLKTSSKLSSNRFAAFIQNKWVISKQLKLTGGVRFNYWDYNSQFLVSPRATFSCKPDWKNDIMFRFSTGVYYQPPFYKELKDLKGNVLNTVKAQKSIHFVGAIDWDLSIWERPFKFTGAVYYKHLSNLIPYKIDNVRIQYLPELKSKGYSVGIDLKLNGEFVEGIESWASLSIMKTQEDIEGDFRQMNYNSAGELIILGVTEDNVIVNTVKKEVGYIPRPTDQRFSFSLFFQDYLPNNPSYKIHLKLIYGSSLPFGPPNSEKYKDVLRIPPYRRVDIGFSKEITGKKHKSSSKKSFKNFQSIWISAEILNLLQINNTISYLWIKDVNNLQYAVPNYLTSRQLNIRIIATF